MSVMDVVIGTAQAVIAGAATVALCVAVFGMWVVEDEGGEA